VANAEAQSLRSKELVVLNKIINRKTEFQVVALFIALILCDLASPRLKFVNNLG